MSIEHHVNINGLVGESPRDWEIGLSRALRQVELIGEIALEPSELSRLIDGLREYYRVDEPDEMAARMVRQMPALLAVYLVFTGVHRYADNNFWDAVREDFPGLTERGVGEMRRGFLRVLRQFGLPTFAHMEGLPYLGPILAHGGIPSSCLPTFFRELLWPAVTDPFWGGMSAQELLAEWSSSTWLLYRVQTPVERFLRYGGRVAEGFLTRCLVMANASLSDAESEEGQAGLPRHVAEAFRAFRRLPESSRHGTEPFPRFRRPRLALDWRGAGVVLQLISQTLDPTSEQGELAWLIEIDGHQQRLPVGLDRRLDGAHTRLVEVALQGPPGRCRATLVRGRECLREWEWTFARDPFSYMVFQASDGLLIERPILPADALWLLAPIDARLEGAKEGETTYEPVSARGEADALGRGWGQFALRMFNVTAYQRLRLMGNDGRSHGLRLEEAGGASCRLEGPMLTPQPAFSALPTLVFSLRDGTTDTWRLRLLPRPGAFPNSAISLTWGEVMPVARSNGTEFELPLGELVAGGAAGTFDIELADGHGRISRMSFVCAPGVVLENILNGTELRVQLPSGVRALDVVGRESGGVWHLGFSAEQRTLPVRLAFRTPGRDEVEVDLDIPTRIFRWAAIGLDGGHSRMAFAAEPLQISLPLLEQAASPSLVVEFPDAEGGAVQATLKLMAPNGKVVQTEAPSSTHQQHVRLQRARFDLSRFQSTLRGSAYGALQLLIGCRFESGREVERQVARLTQDWLPSQVQATWQPGVLELAWSEPAALADRHVWLWDLWRPWLPPEPLPIPDSARGRCQLPLPTETPIGAYRVQLGLKDPWSETLPPLQPQGEAGTCEIFIGDPDSQVAYLENLGDAPLARATRYRAALQSGKASFPELFFLESQVEEDDVLPLLLSLIETQDGPRASRQAWEERMWQILCNYRAWDTGRTLAAFRRTASDDRLQEALEAVLRMGWLRRVGPYWEPEACPMPDGKARTVPVAALDDETRRALYDLWEPLGLGLEPWPLAPDGLARLKRAFGETTIAAHRPWRPGARALYRGCDYVISEIRPTADAEAQAQEADLWRLAVPPGYEIQLEGGPVVCGDESLVLVSEVRADWLEPAMRDISLYLAIPDAQFDAILPEHHAGRVNPLSEGAEQVANARWLRTLRRQPERVREIASWCREYLRPLENLVRQLEERCPQAAVASQAILHRYHMIVNKANDGEAIATLPFLSGAVALICRANAQSSRPATFTGLPAGELDSLMNRIYELAPDRFARDLCIVDMLLGIYGRTRKELHSHGR